MWTKLNNFRDTVAEIGTFARHLLRKRTLENNNIYHNDRSHCRLHRDASKSRSWPFVSVSVYLSTFRHEREFDSARATCTAFECRFVSALRVCQWRAKRQGRSLFRLWFCFLVANELVACMKPIVDVMVKILSKDNEPTDNWITKHNWRDFNQVVKTCVVMPHRWMQAHAKYFWQINSTDRRFQLSTDKNLRLNIISILSRHASRPFNWITTRGSWAKCTKIVHWGRVSRLILI